MRWDGKERDKSYSRSSLKDYYSLRYITSFVIALCRIEFTQVASSHYFYYYCYIAIFCLCVLIFNFLLLRSLLLFFLLLPSLFCFKLILSIIIIHHQQWQLQYQQQTTQKKTKRASYMMNRGIIKENKISKVSVTISIESSH